MPPPVVILGLSRSGTRLVARILGRIPDVMLTTEHADKRKIPEDRSGVRDSEIWWRSFDFHCGRDPSGRPRCEEPVPSAEAEETVRAHYASLSRSGRLIVKNPQHLARLDIVRRVLPDAQLLWVAREPWQLLESAVRSTEAKRRWWGEYSRRAYLRTRECLELPDKDVVARAAHGLGWMADRWRKIGGPVIRYDDLVASPETSIHRLYKAVGSRADAAAALDLPEARPKDTTSIRTSAARSRLAPSIDEWVRRYAKTFGYQADR